MSHFYRPLKGLPLGRMRELWARCDICKFSAPWDQFVAWVKDDQELDLCDRCDQLSQSAVEMLQQGWRSL